MTAGQIYIRPGRDPYAGVCIKVVEPEPGDPARRSEGVLVRRLRPDGEWSETREWMHPELRGWVPVDCLPERGEVEVIDRPSGYYADLIALNIDALVEADHRGAMEVARACFPSLGSDPAVRVLARLRGLTDHTTVPRDSDIAGLVDGLALSSRAAIFAVDGDPALAEVSVNELVAELRRRGHTVEVDPPALEVRPRTWERAPGKHAAMDRAVLETLACGPLNAAEVRRLVSPIPTRHAVSTSLTRLMHAGRVWVRQDDTRYRVTE